MIQDKYARIIGINYIGVSEDEVQEVLDSAARLNLYIEVHKDENKYLIGPPKHVIHLWRQGGWDEGRRSFMLKFGDYAFLEITPRSVTYYNRDFIRQEGNSIDSAGITGLLYFVKSIHDVPKPYYMPQKMLRHYIIVPKLKEFINYLTIYAMLFTVQDGRSSEKEVVTGKMAQQWVALLDEMTNIHVLYRSIR